MNIVYLHSHDTGRCMQPYGFPVHMPAMMSLAATGLTCRNAFSAAPTCSPSRAALLTGQMPHTSGMLGLAHRGFALRDPSQHLASYLRALGYRTVLAGHQHLTAGDPRELGYDTVLETLEVPGERIAAHAVEFLEQAAQIGDETPFFLDVGFTETHRPFPAADPANARYISVLPGLPDTAAVRLDVAEFHSSLRALDRAIGMVLTALDTSELSGQTIVLATTDHGPAFPGMKATLTDAGLGVGLILRIPGLTTPGTVSDALMSQIDLYPTICDVIGQTPPTWLQGVSLVPLLEETRSTIRTEVFGEVTFHAAYEPQRSIRTDRWTLIRRFSDWTRPVLPNIDTSPALDWLIECGWAERALPEVQLFDNALDPLQRVNFAGSAEYAAIERDLWERLQAWMVATDDPLLTGRVDLPPGAVVNRVSDRNPDGELVSTTAEG